MLRKKARPRKRLLKINTSKGYFSSLFSIYHDIMYTNNTFGKALLNSIPVLSIFVLLGIMTYNVVLFNSGFLFSLGEISHEAYADETIGDNTASIVISGSGKNERVTTGRDSTAYRSHTITIKGSNVRDYALNIYGDSNLKYVNGNDVLTSANGAKGSNIPANTWGYAFGDSTSDNSTLSYTAPTSNAVTLLSNTVPTTDITSANSFNVSNNKLVFAARFDQDKPTGSYQASVTLALTVTPRVLTTYTVVYNGNNNTSGTVPNTQTISLYDTDSYEFTVATNSGNLVRTGYTFLGWSEDPTATTATYIAGSSKVQLTSGSPTKTLYAVWEKSVFDGITKMQEMTTAICKSAGIGDSTALKDSRDGKAYTVRKLTDGNCWMTTNLTLDLSVQGIATAAASDNISADYPTTALTNRFNTASTNAWQNDKTIAQFSKEPKKIYSGSYQSNSGYFYSFKAATAATIADNAESGDASGSICPKGWHLPKGGSSGDFKTLYGKYSNNQVSSNKRILLGASTEAAGGTYFPADGSVDSYGLSSGGTGGGYWSRTVYNANSAYGLSFSGSNINLANYIYKYFGVSVRCVAYSESDITEITTMQEMTPEVCSKSAVGATNTLTDTRDGNTYTVRKLADGNCWMTTNLTLDLSKAGIATVAESDNLTSAYPTTALTDRWNTSSANAWRDDKTIAQFSKEPKKIYSGSYQSGSGYFYNFKAATAATIADKTTSGDATGSICPKGWKLPKGNSDGDFQALYSKYKDNQVSSNKRILLGASTEAAGGTYFPADGSVDSYGLSSGGTGGGYWSRTVYDSDYTYSLSFGSSAIYTARYYLKYLGYSVRCVAYSS